MLILDMYYFLLDRLYFYNSSCARARQNLGDKNCDVFYLVFFIAIKDSVY